MPENAGLRNHFIFGYILLILQDIIKLSRQFVFPPIIPIAKPVPAIRKPHHYETILKFL
jgi:hypothetical protein